MTRCQPLLLLIAASLTAALGAAEAAEAVDPFALTPGDQLEIRVFGHEDLTTRIQIADDGAADFPLIGRLDGLIGTSHAQVAAMVKQRLEDGYLDQAITSSHVVAYAPRSVVVMGSVRNQGSVRIHPYQALTALQAIGQAEGFAEDADRSRVVVLRRSEEGHSAIPVPTTEDTDAIGQDVTLRPGDMVLVPRLHRVFIIGAVKDATAVPLPGDGELTVSRAIALAGGFAKYAREGEVQLLRRRGESVSVDVRAVLAGDDQADDPALRPGDIVSVPESRF